jgi:hypothetical protein
MVALAGRASVQQELGDPGYAASVDAAIAISDALGGSFFRPPIRAHLATIALELGDIATADGILEEAYAEAGRAWFQLVWAAHAVIRSSESTGDAARLEDAAARIDAVQGDAVTAWSVSARYARALAALLRGKADAALRGAQGAAELATSMGLRTVRWRLDRIAWRAFEMLGRPDEADERRAAAAAILRDVLATVPDELRPGFLERPLVADVLEG